MTVSQKPQDYCVKELQVVVRDKPAVPVEIEPFVGCSYRSSAEVYQRFRCLDEMAVECFIALHLDAGNRVVGMTTCSLGTLTASLTHPRDIFRPAIVNLTAGLIFLHNHPSGNSQPSDEDLQITRRLCEVGKLVGIRCLDHLIIGKGNYFSFADQGLI